MAEVERQRAEKVHGKNLSEEGQEVVEEEQQLETPVLRHGLLLALQGFDHHRLSEEEMLQVVEVEEVEISKEHYLLVALELT